MDVLNSLMNVSPTVLFSSVGSLIFLIVLIEKRNSIKNRMVEEKVRRELYQREENEKILREKQNQQNDLIYKMAEQIERLTENKNKDDDTGLDSGGYIVFNLPDEQKMFFMIY